ncbi:MAG: universal stress protein [Acidimicrobiia bacterium]|nr:universal stress protein [Acidimicrobiia bacterium]MBT8215739.1 universal stress protein [Acidimicrobiia bacterium]NNF10602.1 universal stress protein [Acidimicrobiia bacterium]NNL69531.1 universal stress protein [Acidimicrobiia bacterium]
MYDHILVAVDGSRHATQAVEVAAEMAQACGSRLSLVHVTRNASFRKLHEEVAAVERSEHFEFSNTDLLEIVGHDVLAEAEQLARGRGVKQVDTGTRIGRPGDEVAEHAEAIGADLIVTGTRGLSDLPGILLGSVSHRIIHLATVPVLVVR